MSKSKRVELQVTVQSQDQWNNLLQKEGLIVVDAYSGWCGPCKAAVSTLKRIKNEMGDKLLHFATAETDTIDSLSLYRGKSQPTFLFFADGTLVYVIRGCNCPTILKTIKNQLEREHKVLDGKVDRIEFIDKVVGMEQAEEEKDEQNSVNEEDEETAISKEVSLAIIKPDAVKAGLVDEIIAKVESEGMEILRKEERTLTKEEAAEFYKQHEGSEHFEDLVEFMSSGPCMTLIISKGDTEGGVIPQIRDLIGPKDVNVAKEEAPTSIRALYGTSSMMNAIHACDTSDSAARELAFFYPNFVSPAVKAKKAKGNQRTLALIRPDALKHHKDSIISKIKEAGFSIAMAKELTLTREEAEDFYSEHRGKDFYEALVHNMCSGPVMALCLAKDDAVEGWRNMLGPKEIDVATEEAPESLRAQFIVEESGFNPLHGSDSVTAADREIHKIFPIQTTVAVIKPDAAAESGDEIIDKIKESGFRIISRKNVGLTKELASQFYHEHEGKDFFNGLTDYMSSGQSTVLLLEREDALTGWRAMMGPTDPNEAREKAPESIRAVFGKDLLRNAVHGSSDIARAGKVIEELFPEVELLSNGRVQVRGGSMEDLSQHSTEQEKLPEDENNDENKGLAADQEGLGEEGQTTTAEGQAAKEEGEVTKEGQQMTEGQATKEGIEESQVTQQEGDETTNVSGDSVTENSGTGKDDDVGVDGDVPSGSSTDDNAGIANDGDKTNTEDTSPAGNTDTSPAGNTDNITSGETTPAGNTDTSPAGNTDTSPAGNTDTVPDGNTDNIPSGETSSDVNSGDKQDDVKQDDVKQGDVKQDDVKQDGMNNNDVGGKDDGVVTSPTEDGGSVVTAPSGTTDNDDTKRNSEIKEDIG